ncbi:MULTISPECIES: hypothetical protein [Clostridium]|uniref:Uncharacterized protein n=1 Tax=Clostridium intestinale DSM 6191 TaxID=1121320 RepID=A0A1M5Z476_9CLOT|nr:MULTISPECIES: hypothetical protein [Clostridium]SHI19045.1 hypothetical protein SAMN02745941_02576 [Clostridium intestinale DSM 6191]
MIHSGTKLSPPWVTQRNKIACTIGLDPQVEVGELEERSCEKYVVRILVNDNKKAKAIANMLVPEYVYGESRLKIKVYAPCEIRVYPRIHKLNGEELSKLLTDALGGNPLYRGFVITDGIIPNVVAETVGQVVGIIKKEIVQFFNDDITDLCGNYNEVASKVFNSIIRRDYNPATLSFTTEDRECLIGLSSRK